MHVNTKDAGYLVTTVDQVDGEVMHTTIRYAALSDAVRAWQVSGQVPVSIALIERTAPVEADPVPESLIPSIDEAVALGMLPDRAAEIKAAVHAMQDADRQFFGESDR